MIPLVKQVMGRPGTRRSCPEQDREPLRAHHGNRPQRESRQADRVWQDGQDPGNQESDHHRLRSVLRTAGGFGVAVTGNRDA